MGESSLSCSICTTCGTQFGPSEGAPAHCPICEDERQYIGLGGQQWTRLEDLQRDHHNIIRELEPGLTGIGTHPEFAIAQRALLVQTPAGNILWDCISLLDPPTRAVVQSLGGISAIAISHPHYYSSMVEWSRAFDAPIYLHAADRQWVMRADPRYRVLGREHPGAGRRHHPDPLRGAFSGRDRPALAGRRRGPGSAAQRRYPDGRARPSLRQLHVQLPQPHPPARRQVRRIAEAVSPYPFDRIYGAWWDRVVPQDGKAAVARSAERYIAALEAEEK